MEATSFPDLALDFDATLVKPSGNDKFLDYLEQVRSITCDRELFAQSGNWQKATGLNQDQLGVEYAAFQHSPAYRAPPAMPGAKIAVRVLLDYFTLHIVTARGKESADVTRKEIHHHFRGSFSSVSYSTEGVKAERVTALRAFLLIEDSIEHALQVAEVAKVILFPSPNMNSHHVHPNIVLPKAYDLIGDGMDDQDWHTVWLMTWQEIPDLVKDIYATRHQTKVAVH